MLLDGLDTLRYSGFFVTLTQHLHLFFVREPVREISEEEGRRADGGEALVRLAPRLREIGRVVHHVFQLLLYLLFGLREIPDIDDEEGHVGGERDGVVYGVAHLSCRSAGLQKRDRARVLADDGFERVRLKRLKDIAIELKVQHAAVKQHTAGEGALVVKIGKLFGHLVGLFDLALREQRIAEVHHHRAVDESIPVFIYDGWYLLRVDHGADLIQCFAQHIEVFHGVFVAHRLPDGQLPVGALGVLCEELLTDLSYLFVCLGLVELIQKFVSCHDVCPLFIRNVFCSHISGARAYYTFKRRRLPTQSYRYSAASLYRRDRRGGRTSAVRRAPGRIAPACAACAASLSVLSANQRP